MGPYYVPDTYNRYKTNIHLQYCAIINIYMTLYDRASTGSFLSYFNVLPLTVYYTFRWSRGPHNRRWLRSNIMLYNIHCARGMIHFWYKIHSTFSLTMQKTTMALLPWSFDVIVNCVIFNRLNKRENAHYAISYPQFNLLKY